MTQKTHLQTSPLAYSSPEGYPTCSEVSTSSPTGNTHSMMTYPVQCVAWKAQLLFWWYRQSLYVQILGICSIEDFWCLMLLVMIIDGRVSTIYVYIMTLNIWRKERDAMTTTAISCIRCKQCVDRFLVLRIKMASTSLALFVLYSRVKLLKTLRSTKINDLFSFFFLICIE